MITILGTIEAFKEVRGGKPGLHQDMLESWGQVLYLRTALIVGNICMHVHTDTHTHRHRQKGRIILHQMHI